MHALTTFNDKNKLIESKHEGVRYLCDRCVYTATTSRSIKILIERKHEEVTYPCDKCEFSGRTSFLNKHIKGMHD